MPAFSIPAKVKASLLALSVLAFSYIPFASAISIDGQFNDWGITPAKFGSSDWVPNSGIAYEVEDHDPKINYLNPGYGGQLYDAEAMYFKQEGMTAYFAMVTGLPWPGDGKGIVYGDFAFDFGSNGSYEFGLEALGNNGFTLGHLYENAVWDDPYWTESTPFDLLGGDDIGEVEYAYNNTSFVAHKHYAIEFSIPISYFGSYWDENGNPTFTLHWTMSCGNDAINLKVKETPTNAVPEPASMALFGMGLAGAHFLRRKKKLA